MRSDDFTLPSTLAPLGFKVDGQNIIGAQFSEIGWTFFASYPPWPSGGVGQTFVHLLPLIVLIAGSVLLAKRLYRHLYAPVEELLTRMGGSLEEDVNEFDYIWKRTSQISQKAHQLDASLSHSQQKLVEQPSKTLCWMIISRKRSWPFSWGIRCSWWRWRSRRRKTWRAMFLRMPKER